MFGKGKQHQIPTKQAKKATLILFKSIAINYEKIVNDAVKEDTDFIKELREYVIQLLNKSEYALFDLNTELLNRGELQIEEKQDNE